MRGVSKSGLFPGSGGLVKVDVPLIFTPEELMIAALIGVESESIRTWATSENNGPIFLKLAGNMIAKHGGDGSAVDRMTILIVSLAIGL